MILKTLNLRYIESRFNELKKAKESKEQLLGKRISWENFIYMKILREEKDE